MPVCCLELGNSSKDRLRFQPEGRTGTTVTSNKYTEDILFLFLSSDSNCQVLPLIFLWP